jgi:4,5-DOPA dioxygenase extradiol
MKNTLLPVVFFAHGSPMNAVADNAYTKALAAYGSAFPRPRALVVISAHWLTHGTFITAHSHPKQIYDFYGFPDELYEVQYSPAGLPSVAAMIHETVPEIKMDPERGIDHAGWVVAKHLFPQENVPLLEISLDVDKSPEEHFAFAKSLRKCRNENVFFAGSGNLVHNLGEIDYEENAEPYSWAEKANEWFEERITGDNSAELVEYEKYLPDHRRVFPANDHYLPSLYILGMKNKDEKNRLIHNSIQNGSISMLSFEVR